MRTKLIKSIIIITIAVLFTTACDVEDFEAITGTPASSAMENGSSDQIGAPEENGSPALTETGSVSIMNASMDVYMNKDAYEEIAEMFLMSQRSGIADISDNTLLGKKLINKLNRYSEKTREAIAYYTTSRDISAEELINALELMSETDVSYIKEKSYELFFGGEYGLIPYVIIDEREICLKPEGSWEKETYDRYFKKYDTTAKVSQFIEGNYVVTIIDDLGIIHSVILLIGADGIVNDIYEEIIDIYYSDEQLPD